jgi:hypothetical protein
MECCTGMLMKSRPASNIFRRSPRSMGCLGSASYFPGLDARGAHIQALGGFADQCANPLDIRIPATVGLAL